METIIVKIFSWIKLIIKLLLYLIILPFWLIYILVRYWIFRYNFKKQLQLTGLEHQKIKYLTKELSFTMPFKEFI